jgi:hypothetical protein
MSKPQLKHVHKFKPLIPNFKSTSIIKAFTLNAIVTALIAFTAVISHELLGDKIKKKVYVYLSTIGITFASAFLCYGLMYLLFGYGRGMLANPVLEVPVK